MNRTEEERPMQAPTGATQIRYGNCIKRDCLCWDHDLVGDLLIKR